MSKILSIELRKKFDTVNNNKYSLFLLSLKGQLEIIEISAGFGCTGKLSDFFARYVYKIKQHFLSKNV